MKRYFFDYRDGDVLVVDEEGLALPSVRAAQTEAVRSLAELVKDSGADAISTGLQAIEVRDEAGPLLDVSFVFKFQRYQ